MITQKEKTVLRFLAGVFDMDYSINNIAKECSLAPNGALKILKKFEREGILRVKPIANIKSYKLNFESEKILPVLELAFAPELEGRVKRRADDLKELKEITKCCVIFGSYADLKKEPRDLDLLFVLDKKNYKEYKKRLKSVSSIIPARVHDMVQTEEDLKKNLLNGDKVILKILREGVVLWGQKTLAEVVKNAYNK